LSVLDESTESISGETVPADMLDMKDFSEMSHAFGSSLADLLFYLYHFCSVYFDSIIPTLMLTELNWLQPNGATRWGKGL